MRKRKKVEERERKVEMDAAEMKKEITMFHTHR